MTVAAELTLDLVNYLRKHNYTHIWCTGIIESKQDAMDTEDYFLQPLLPGDPRINFDTVEEKCLSINALDVEEMALGTSGIRFIIHVPQNLYYNFLTAPTI